MKYRPYAFKISHVSADPTTVSHCCFAAETMFLTRDGWMTFEDAVGTVQTVLTRRNRPGRSGYGGEGGYGGPQLRGWTGEWVEAPINAFGEQQIWEVHLRRNQQSKVIRTTANHRWIRRGSNGFVTTDQLRDGDRLDACLPKTLIGPVTPSAFGIAHGVVYGDGSRLSGGSVVRLWGDKDANLLPYFAASPQTPVKTPNGVLGVQVSGMPGFFKDAPPIGESAQYLYGWLAGYFAADGAVTSQGQASLSSANKESLETAQRVALRLGISTYDITMQMRRGYGIEDTPIYKVQFVNSSLRPSFFLIPEHRIRFEEHVEKDSYERLRWTVASIVATEVIEPVYCATVPETEMFVIEGNILTGNCFCGSGAIVGRSDGGIECTLCNRSFTVMEQPLYSNMPSTDPGAAVEATPHDPLMQEEPFDPGMQPPPTVPQGQAAPVASPQAQPATAVPMVPQRPAPSFVLGSGFATRSGVRVGEEDFVMHHAIRLARGE